MIRACFDVWCDLCKEPAQATAGGSETRAEALAVAKEAGFARLRIDGHLVDVCANCVTDHGGTNQVRQRIREISMGLRS